jgi:hypothetical protein
MDFVQILGDLSANLRLVRLSFVQLAKDLEMPATLLRVALWAMGVTLGSFGVFFAVVSCSRPVVSGDAVVLLGAALAINYFLAG